MFPNLQLEILDRFTAVEQFFRKSPKTGDLGQIAKGLVFVQIYAAYEHTVRASVGLAIAEITANRHLYSDLRAPLLAIFLDPQLKALRECPESSLWANRLELFKKSLSNSPITAVATIPHDGSHFRHTQANIVLKSLGINRKLTLRRHQPYRLDEVVGYRNAIAHGSETAQNVGRQFSRKEIWKRIRLMKRVCLRIVAITSEHCSMPDRHCR